METLIVLASLVAVIGITSFGIVLVNKDSKALKALGVVCFCPAYCCLSRRLHGNA